MAMEETVHRNVVPILRQQRFTTFAILVAALTLAPGVSSERLGFPGYESIGLAIIAGAFDLLSGPAKKELRTRFKSSKLRLSD